MCWGVRETRGRGGGGCIGGPLVQWGFPIHRVIRRPPRLQPLEKERINRMLALALNTERLKEMQLNASSLLSEVSTEYHRTMSSIIFDHLSKNAAVSEEDSIFTHFTPPPAPAPNPVPEYGMVQIPSHNCLDQRHGFAFHTLLSKREIIGCMIRVRAPPPPLPPPPPPPLVGGAGTHGVHTRARAHAHACVRVGAHRVQ